MEERKSEVFFWLWLEKKGGNGRDTVEEGGIRLLRGWKGAINGRTGRG